MYPIQFEGAKEMHKPSEMTDEQCYSLWAMQHQYKFKGADGKENQGFFWVEMWQPSKEDIEAINAGRPIIIQIHSYSLPPVALFTLDENGNSNND